MGKSILFLLFIQLLFSCKSSTEVADQPPNIVIIYADDMGWADVGYNGNDFYETPYIDKMASEGLVLNRFYPSAANCAPSRASMLSGTYATRHKIYLPQGLARGGDVNEMKFKVPTLGADSSFNTFPVSINTLDPAFLSLAELLKKADYTTARYGKWHVGDDNQGFDISSANGDEGYITNINGVEKRFYTDTTVAQKLTTASIEFIKDNKDKPFFLYLAHWEVHGPNAAKKERIDYYKEKKNKTNVDVNAIYAAEVEQIDLSVRRIYETLEKEHLLENTLVIFTSDNGGVVKNTNNAPLRAGKGTFYEGGLRTPCVMMWKGVIQPGSKSEAAINGIDFMPTFADIANIELPKGHVFDGESILPLLTKDDFKRNKPLFFHFPLYLGGGGTVLPTHSGSEENYWRAVPLSVIMKENWKLIKYYEYDTVELYDLDKDISEANDLSDQEKEKKEELLEELSAWLEATNAPIPNVLNK